MIPKRWSKKSDAMDRAPENIGVYELAYARSTVYIGSGEIRARLYACDKKGMSFNQVRWQETNSTVRARQKERKYLKQFKDRHGRLPKYNNRIPSPP